MIEFWWHFKLDKIVNKVTSPHPWVDSSGISQFGDLVNQRIQDMAAKAEKLQIAGWALKIDSYSIMARHSFFENDEEALKSCAGCGISRDEITLVSHTRYCGEM
jgi:hypothetical protein